AISRRRGRRGPAAAVRSADSRAVPSDHLVGAIVQYRDLCAAPLCFSRARWPSDTEAQLSAARSVYQPRAWPRVQRGGDGTAEADRLAPIAAAAADAQSTQLRPRTRSCLAPDLILSAHCGRAWRRHTNAGRQQRARLETGRRRVYALFRAPRAGWADAPS